MQTAELLDVLNAEAAEMLSRGEEITVGYIAHRITELLNKENIFSQVIGRLNIPGKYVCNSIEVHAASAHMRTTKPVLIYINGTYIDEFGKAKSSWTTAPVGFKTVQRRRGGVMRYIGVTMYCSGENRFPREAKAMLSDVVDFLTNECGFAIEEDIARYQEARRRKIDDALQEPGLMQRAAEEIAAKLREKGNNDAADAVAALYQQ